MEKSTEIQIMRNDHMFVIPCPSHDRGIRCVGWADIHPMNGFMSGIYKQTNPVRRQVHIQQNLQADCRRSSCSSALQAA